MRLLLFDNNELFVRAILWPTAPPCFEMPVIPPFMLENTMVEVTPDHVPAPPVYKRRRSVRLWSLARNPTDWVYDEEGSPTLKALALRDEQVARQLRDLLWPDPEWY